MLENKEKAFKQLDYDIKVREIDKEVAVTLLRVKELFGEEALFSENVRFKDDETSIPLVASAKYGIFVFVKFYQEVTDLKLYQSIKTLYEKFQTALEGLNEENLTFYVLLNTPITQKAFYALFNPYMDFLMPVDSLEESIRAEISTRPICFEDSDVFFYEQEISGFAMRRKRPAQDDTYFEDETGKYIKKRGDWHKLSDADPDRYYNLLLVAGIFGIHKLYLKKYGAFLVYFLTLGFCGTGWFFDMLEIFFGIAKDKEKHYIGPFENKGQKFIGFIIGCPFITLMLYCMGRIFIWLLSL